MSSAQIAAEQSAQMEIDGEPETTPQVAQQYLTWKKNSPFLYETLATFEISWPSLTIQWGQELKSVPKSNRKSQSLLLGTHTTGQAEDFLRIGWITFPDDPRFDSLAKYDADTGLIGGHTPQTAADFRITQKIDHLGGVNRARFNPLHPNLFASISTTGQTGVYDVTKYPNNPCGVAQPNISLVGHKTEGLALAWSPQVDGWLATADEDGRVLAWDIKSYAGGGKLAPFAEVKHEGAVNDLSWHPHHNTILASVGDDSMLRVSDVREPKSKQWASPHLGKVASAISWNPVSSPLLAIGFDTGEVELWDVRNSASRLHTMENPHKDAVTSLCWSPHKPTAFATASLDNSVLIWDAANIAANKCRIFQHMGHTAPVTDVSWNPAMTGMLASVAGNNAVHVFRPAQDILGF